MSTVATTVTPNIDRSRSSTATHSSIGVRPVAIPTKTAATVDDFFKDARGIAPTTHSWQQDSILIHSSSGFDKTNTDEAPIRALDVMAPIIATGQGGAFVASPVAISPVNGDAPAAMSRFATTGYHRAMDPRVKRQDHPTEIKEIEYATVSVMFSWRCFHQLYAGGVC